MGRERAGGNGLRSHACTFQSNQSLEAALPLPGQFTLLNVYFLNKPNSRNRPSLCLRCRLAPSSQTRLCPQADVHLTWLWS